MAKHQCPVCKGVGKVGLQQIEATPVITSKGTGVQLTLDPATIKVVNQFACNCVWCKGKGTMTAAQYKEYLWMIEEDDE